jgi:hypothetical protein
VRWAPESPAITIEFDGVVRRMLLCPSDLNPDHVQALIKDAEIDAIVTNQSARWLGAAVDLILEAYLPERAKKTTRRARNRMADADVGPVALAPAPD